MAAQLTLDTIDIHSTDLLASRGYPWAEWDLLRFEAPVYWYERDDIEPVALQIGEFLRVQSQALGELGLRGRAAEAGAELLVEAREFTVPLDNLPF